MPRSKSRIRHDEVTRLLKAVTDFGLKIDRVTFEDGRLEVVIWNAERNKTEKPTARSKQGYTPLIREPKL
ncbi:MAG: hypothetical protein AAGF25_04400 [Pseudomonadota bacterium]